MIENKLFMIIAVNSILIIVILFILFRLETNKIKSYLKRIDKKISRNKIIEYDNDNDNDNNRNIPVQTENKTENKMNINDIDSYIDPMSN